MKSKFLSLILVLLIIMSTCSVSFAASSDMSYNDTMECVNDLSIPAKTETSINEEGELTVTKVVNEGDMILALQRLTDDELRTSGYSDENIKELRAINVAPLTRAAKESYGDVTYSIRYHDYSYDAKSKKTYISTTMAWTWSKTPKCIFKDIPAMTVGADFKARTSSSGKVLNDAHVNYYRYGKKNSSYSGYKKIVEDHDIKTNKAGSGSYIKLSMMKLNLAGTHPGEYYALGGGITTKWVASGKKIVIPMSANYGHTIITADVSVTFGTTGKSITFTPAKKIMHGANAYLCRE